MKGVMVIIDLYGSAAVVLISRRKIEDHSVSYGTEK
jgi:hypothetical protein